MQLSLQNFSTLVDNMGATVQGACSNLIDLTVGSALRAILEASASVALWLQYLLLQVLATTRLATSIGGDADSWVQDFGMTRLPATYSTGQVVMSSFSPASQAATISNGATVRTADGSQTFAVVDGPYVRAIGTSQVTVTVQAMAAGPGGNVAAGAITLLGTAISGIDTVSNINSLSGGAPAETDAALRQRFVTYINTRSQATEQAIGYAVASVQQGLTYNIQENVTPDGTFTPGHVNVVVDDGSGAPPAVLIAAVAAAIDLIRPVGTSVSVSGPTLIRAIIGLTLTIGPAESSATIIAEITTALNAYINGLGVAQPLRFTRIAGLCYDADSSVTNVQNVLLNGGMVDVGGMAGSVVRAGTISLQVLTS